MTEKQRLLTINNKKKFLLRISSRLYCGGRDRSH